MVKLFTVERANDLIPDVDQHVSALQRNVEDLKAVQARRARARPGSIDARNAGQELTFLASAIHDAQRELARLGVEVRDVERGVVAFPGRLGGEVVDLVWRQGHDAVTHYQRHTGDGRATPLPARGPDVTSEGSPSA